jgi:PAS domain S-box-containing protein
VIDGLHFSPIQVLGNIQIGAALVFLTIGIAIALLQKYFIQLKMGANLGLALSGFVYCLLMGLSQFQPNTEETRLLQQLIWIAGCVFVSFYITAIARFVNNQNRLVLAGQLILWSITLVSLGCFVAYLWTGKLILYGYGPYPTSSVFVTEVERRAISPNLVTCTMGATIFGVHFIAGVILLRKMISQSQDKVLIGATALGCLMVLYEVCIAVVPNTYGCSLLFLSGLIESARLGYLTLLKALAGYQTRLGQAESAGKIGLWFMEDFKRFVGYGSEMYYRIYDRPYRPHLPSFAEWLSWVHPEDREQVRATAERAIQHEEEYLSEYRIICADQSIRWVRLSGRMRLNPDRTPMLLAGSVADITVERNQVIKKQERINELLAAVTSIARLKQELAQFFDLTLDLLCIIGPDGTFNKVNPAFSKVLGYSDEEILSQTLINFIHPDDIPSTLKKSKQLAAGIPTLDFENRFRSKDGTYRLLSWSCNPDPKTGLLYAAARDITERKLVEAERAMTQALRDTNRTKDLFLATLSHELRTPLTAILSWAQLLKTGKIDAVKTKMGLQAIEDSALSQNQLISDLLDISRINAGKISVEMQIIELTELVRKVMDTFRVSVEKKSIQLVDQLGSSAVYMQADPGRLRQVIWNLLSNAIKFTATGGTVELTVNIDRNEERNIVQISIRDTGKGIPAKFLPHIFELFTQADSSSVRIHGGLGIGLSLVHSLLQLQGGSIQAESPGEGRGSTFTVNFTAQLEHPEAPSENSDARPQTGLDLNLRDSHGLRGVKLLLVDDEEMTLHSTQEMLAAYGASVQVATSAHEAIEIFKRGKFDALISDIGMPNENGYSLIRRIRKMSVEEGSLIPALALTAYADAQSRDLALFAGYTAHRPKPIDSTDLVRTLLNIIRPTDEG